MSDQRYRTVRIEGEIYETLVAEAEIAGLSLQAYVNSVLRSPKAKEKAIIRQIRVLQSLRVSLGGHAQQPLVGRRSPKS